MGVYQGEHSLAVSAKSAYHQAVAGGYTGSEDDFNRALAAVGEWGAPDATDVSFDGSAVGMTAANVEDAIEELFTDVSNGKQIVASAITDKGVTTAEDATYQEMADNIAAIETGVDTSDATAVEADLAYGKTAYANGQKIIGAHVCDPGLDTSDATATAENIDRGKTAYVNGEKVTGVSTKVDTSGATVGAADILAGKIAYGADGEITGTMPTVDAGTPTISVSSSGLITATASQEAGYCLGGSQTKTWQLSTQATTTYTPGTANQTISSGKYLTGSQTILGDANLTSDNIKSGVSIFGVAGSLEASSVQAATVSVRCYTTDDLYLLYQDTSGSFGAACLSDGDKMTIDTYVGAWIYGKTTSSGALAYNLTGVNGIGPGDTSVVEVASTSGTIYFGDL